MNALKVLILPFTLLISQFGFGKIESLLKRPSPQIEEKFLRAAFDVRLMDLNEGMAAVERSIDPAVRRYAELMVKDQGMLREELNRIAAAKELSLPDYLSAERKQSLTSLKQKTGFEFDKKFISMMIMDRRTELQLFRRAVQFHDVEISTFARKYLSLIHAHLLMAESLR